MSIKEVGISVDLLRLEKDLAEKQSANLQQTGGSSVRTTVFTLGRDSNVGTKQQIGTPELTYIEILQDALMNPYVEVNWSVSRFDVDSGLIVGFNVFRRKLSQQESVATVPFGDLDRASFDRLARKNKKIGSFYEERKAMYNVRRGAVPLSIRNSNLEQTQLQGTTALFKRVGSGDVPGIAPAELERFLLARTFTKVAYIDYSKFLSEQKRKMVFIKNRDFAELLFRDKSVVYGDTYEYYVVSVTKEIGDGPRSNSATVTIENTNQIGPPSQLKVKQVSESQVKLSISCNPKDSIIRAFIFRRKQDDLVFEFLIDAPNITDYICIIDEDVRYGKHYVYRVFLQNVYGVISEPGEITFASTVQRFTPESRSNTLAIPFVLASQDQSSQYVRIVIPPNDALICLISPRQILLLFLKHQQT